MDHEDYEAEELAALRARSVSERVSDAMAAFGGSWGFILAFAATGALWITLNAGAAAFDPYPYLLMNLALNIVAAIQAPIILMSQRRVETRDRARARQAHRVISDIERELRRLHEKLDAVPGREGGA